MPSNHLILCHPLLLPPSIFPSTRVFSSESVLPIRWPNYWSFNFNWSTGNNSLRNKINIYPFPLSSLVCLSYLFHDLLSSHVDRDHLFCFKNQLKSHFGVDLLLRRPPCPLPVCLQALLQSPTPAWAWAEPNNLPKICKSNGIISMAKVMGYHSKVGLWTIARFILPSSSLSCLLGLIILMKQVATLERSLWQGPEDSFQSTERSQCSFWHCTQKWILPTAIMLGSESVPQ